MNRERALARLEGLMGRGRGLAVVYGRRRIGKTRLLVEWVKKHNGVYAVADQSAPEVQRAYLAEAVEARLPGFSSVHYPDWRVLLARLAREARAEGWRGPLVLDELPYLVLSTPELPAILQRFIDHEAGELVVVLAGSSQHMMQGLALDGDAPLYGRAQEVLEVLPLSARLLGSALQLADPAQCVEHFAAWGGVPRYWELAVEVPGDIVARVDRLVLDPLGPLHREPDRLIVEELPPATEVRPLLDAIGAGAHRVSEMAGRIGRPATSLARPLQRLIGMGLVTREVPFGENAKTSKRSLYRIQDPLTRLWFRTVAPYRGPLATATPAGRKLLFKRHWPLLFGAAWEDLCRTLLPTLDAETPLGRLGPWGPASRWWRGTAPEWDVVAISLDGRRLLLGEVKVSSKSLSPELKRLSQRAAPPIADRFDPNDVTRALFLLKGPQAETEPLLVSAEDVLATSKKEPSES